MNSFFSSMLKKERESRKGRWPKTIRREVTDLEMWQKNRLLSELTELDIKENTKDYTWKLFFILKHEEWRAMNLFQEVDCRTVTGGCYKEKPMNIYLASLSPLRRMIFRWKRTRWISAREKKTTADEECCMGIPNSNEYFTLEKYTRQ